MCCRADSWFMAHCCVCVCGGGRANTCPRTTAQSCLHPQEPIITAVTLPSPHQSHKPRQRPTHTWRPKHPVPSPAAHKHGNPFTGCYSSPLSWQTTNVFLLFNFFSLLLCFMSVQCHGSRAFGASYHRCCSRGLEREREREVFCK